MTVEGTAWEVVHHKDENRLNNSIDNLETLSFADHTSLHHVGSRKSYDTRRTMEAMANMRQEIIRLRGDKSDLLAACKDLLQIIDRLGGEQWLSSVAGTSASDAIAKAEGNVPTPR